MRLNIGDKVKFVDTTEEHISVPHYSTDGPDIIHGQTTVGEKYWEEWAEIVALYEDRYVVRYIGENDRYVQLEFKGEYLIPIEISNWKDYFGGK